MTLATWLVIIILIAINALYVAAEFAAVSVRRSRIRQLAEEGNLFARRLLPSLEDTTKLDRYVATCQIGITLSSLVLGAYGQATLAIELAPSFERWGGMQAVAAQSTSAVVVLTGLTVLQVILGELVPKSLALQYPTQMALYTVEPMRLSQVCFSWFIAFLNGSGIAILKLLRVPYGSHRHIHSPEEIDMLIVQSRDGGLLEPDEQQRLHEAIQLSSRPARQLMVPRWYVKAIDIATPVKEVLHQVANGPYTRLPVYRESVDTIVGMLHTKDLVVHYLAHGKVPSIEQVMRPVLYVPENVNAYRLLALLRDGRSHQAIVIDEYGGFIGLVTLEDVLTELFGEISDEFKGEQPQPERLPDGRVRLPGLMRLEDAEPWIGVCWKGESDTVGGHVTEALGHIPSVGERITIDGVTVEVEHMVHHAVASLIATPVITGEKEDSRG
ncbi:MAG: hemolysin family protein [Alphaproteobacteria bacterium]|uniref:Hemolysin family protein n=1 Tax=Candidatus Nitrobium versatile TaxID=2884831 RepID=A0A953M024_9BACT|nr:hemolysin family protein [Candidatus Nitrobium versatile]